MELRESEKDREFIKVANSIIIRWKANGCIEFINDFGLKTFGYTKEELIGKNVNILVPKTESNGKDLGNLVKDIAAHPESYSLNENENIKKNGERIWIIWTNQAIKDEEGKVKEILAIGNDITRIKRQSNELRLSLEVLNLFNRADKSIDAVSAVLFLIKQSIGFDAVGIRLSEGEDFPYYVTNGFPGHFLEKERYLCQRDEMGKIVRDALGNPILECMCGNVISGRIDASLPFFTEGGSFWTNSTTDLLASTREKERQGRTRNRCNGEGYESVALIPIKSGKDIIGLLQLNDRRRGQLNKEMVNFFESLGSSIGSLLSQKKTEELLRQEHQRFQELFDNMSSGVAVYTVKDDGKDFIIKDINKSGEHSSKVIRDEIVGKSLLQVFPGVEKIGLFKVFQEVWRNGKPQRHPVSLYKDERMFQWVENYVYKLPSGEIVAVYDDVTERKQAEKLLSIQQKFNAAVLDNINAGVVACDEKGELVLFNQTARLWHGLDPLNIKQEKWANYYNLYLEDGITPMDINTVPLARAFRGETVHEVRMVIAAKNKPKRYIIANAGPIKSEDGQILGAVAVMHDITEIRKMEESILQSEERYRGIVDNIGIGVALISPEMEILSLNKQMKKWNPHIDLKDKHICYRSFNKPPREEVCSYCPTVKTLRDGLVHEDVTETPMGGQVFNYRIVSSPIKNEAGKVVAAIEMVEDITERKKAEEALRASEERLRDITFSMADWLWEVDENGVYTYTSQKGLELLGRSREEIIGKTPFDFMPPDEVKRVAKIFSEAAAKKEPIKDLENWNIRKNGDRICLLTNGVPILDKNGNLKGYRGVDKDITERKMLEREAQKRLQELEVFYKSSVGREERILELKKEIEQLKNNPGRRPL